jgi:hypothetical protein
MEQGPYLYLELLSGYTGPQGPSLRRLLGDQALQGDVFPSAGLEVLLEPGFACILVSEGPRVAWPSDEIDPQPASVAGPYAAHPGVGPDARAPQALGEVLLATRSDPPLRSMLVFVPRIPTGLWQPYDAAAGASPHEEPSDAVE